MPRLNLNALKGPYVLPDRPTQSRGRGVLRASQMMTSVIKAEIKDVVPEVEQAPAPKPFTSSSDSEITRPTEGESVSGISH